MHLTRAPPSLCLQNKINNRKNICVKNAQDKECIIMPKRKSKGIIAPWLSARADNVEGRFIQIGNSMLLSREFQKLTVGSRYLYFCMAMEAGGQKNFHFPLSAAKKYGIKPSTFWTYVHEL